MGWSVRWADCGSWRQEGSVCCFGACCTPEWNDDLAALAAAANQRAAELGRAAAADPPAWAVEALGPVPNARIVLFGLQASLFHAGLSDEPPRPRTRTAAPRRDRWEDAPTVLAQTLTGYLDQLRVTRRPSTVANEDEALREFASGRASSSRRSRVTPFCRWSTP